MIVTKRFLLLEAALIWTFAGGMLLYRGSLMLYSSSGFSWLKIMTCVGCGLLFFRLLFSRISRQHIHRITSLFGDYHIFLQFFSTKSYLMMLGMISLGVFLRKTSLVPVPSLSIVYITMGVPLLLSSFRFYHSWYYYLPAINGPLN